MKFVEDQTAFRGKGRFDGKPTNADAFAFLMIDFASLCVTCPSPYFPIHNSPVQVVGHRHIFLPFPVKPGGIIGSDTIQRILDGYQEDLVKGINEAGREAAEECKKILRQNSPKRFFCAIRQNDQKRQGLFGIERGNGNR